MSQIMEGPYINGAPDSKPSGFEIPLVEVEFHSSTQMDDVQLLVDRLQVYLENLGFSNVRIAVNFLQVLDQGAPAYNIKAP